MEKELGEYELKRLLADKVSFALYGESGYKITRKRDKITIQYNDGRRFIFAFGFEKQPEEDDFEPS